MNQLDEAVRSLRRQLRDLDAEERKIAAARRRINAALRALNADPARGTARRNGTAPTNMTLATPAVKAVLEAVRDDPDTAWTAIRVANAIGPAGYSPSAYRAALRTLAHAGVLRRTGRGIYVLHNPKETA